MNELLKQLHDIEGLDAISMWPLAIGWWVLIALGSLIIILAIWLIARWIAFRRSWKHDAFRKLDRLDSELSDDTAKQTAVALSEYLRRIVLKRYPRNECAGLVGDAWLQWLSRHDPKEFDWQKKGVLLNQAPYAPSNLKLPALQVKELIQAARDWVR